MNSNSNSGVQDPPVLVGCYSIDLFGCFICTVDAHFFIRSSNWSHRMDNNRCTVADPGFRRQDFQTPEVGAKSYYYRPQTKLREGACSRGGLVLGGVPAPGGSGPGGCARGDPPDGYCCGRYASYWNAFLFGKIFAQNCIKMKKIGTSGGTRS